MNSEGTYKKAFQLLLTSMALTPGLPTQETMEAVGLSKEQYIADLRAAACLVEGNAANVPFSIRQNISRVSVNLRTRSSETLRNRADALEASK